MKSSVVCVCVCVCVCVSVFHMTIVFFQIHDTFSNEAKMKWEFILGYISLY